MGSALLNTTSGLEFAPSEESARAEATPQTSTEALRAQVAERLAAHRARRSGEAAQASRPEQPRQTNSRSAQIAATVAERYAKTQSYRAFLAAEAERATQQARAVAEVAALNAQAVAAAQQRLLDALDRHEIAEASQDKARADAVRRDAAEAHAREIAARNKTAAVELNLWPDLEAAQREDTRGETARPARTPRRNPAASVDAAAGQSPNASSRTAAGLTVRLYEDAASSAHVYLGRSHHPATGAHTNRREEPTRNEAEAYALDEEIAFRQAPVFEEPAGPPVPLPANLIQFPRQLVASRKARPRYAEGPLREEEEAPGDGQLRIFEVDPAQISTHADAADPAAPQWTSIWLDTPSGVGNSAAEFGALDEYAPGSADALPEVAALLAPPPIQAASIRRRILASAINTAIVGLGTLGFAAIFLSVSARGVQWPVADDSRMHAVGQLGAAIAVQTGLLPLQAAAIGAGAFAILALLYHALFFWFSGATPGMRAAHIALCTFDDENPTRRAVRRRLGAMLLSACPLGLGFVLAALDEERLTWHDRVTKMYLRSY